MLRIAVRYTLAAGRGHLSVFMSGISVVGLILGTALLLAVLSVMNGFEREMRERILSLVPHATVYTPRDGGEPYGLATSLAALPGVTDVQSFVSFDAMAVRGSEVTAVTGLGVDQLGDVSLAGLSLPDPRVMGGVALGDSVARRLQLDIGDRITLIVPGTGVSRGEPVASARYPVAAIIDTGTELDETLALLPIDEASQLAGLDGGISGLRLRLADPFQVDERLPELRAALSPGSYAITWRMTHGNLYAAIQLSRDLVVLLLASIIGVAAFNVVSALVLIVIDQRGAIAIMRTLGATPGAMARLFLTQGLIIGLVGSVFGCLLGVALSALLPGLVASLEERFQFQFLNTDVYPVSFVPVDLRAEDAVLVGVIATLMCVLASVYPAVRAARLAPASVLHQDA